MEHGASAAGCYGGGGSWAIAWGVIVLIHFWSCFKRSLKGTYISVEPFHLQAYADEQAFRFNHHKDLNDADRFDIAVTSDRRQAVDVG
ncbi:MAG: transposase [Acidobacteriota bacterium]